MKQESVTLDYRPYRPLRAGERYCPACGADTLRREPDGTVYYVGHSEANCYKRQLSQARAEAERWRRRHDALRAAVIKAEADYASRADGLDDALMILRQLLAEAGGGGDERV